VVGVTCDGHFAFRVRRGELGSEWGCVDSWCCYVPKFE
jgi:hypothetical protein